MKKRIRLWFCKKLGWHRIGRFLYFDGCSVHAECSVCGYQGIIDSQGNLF